MTQEFPVFAAQLKDQISACISFTTRKRSPPPAPPPVVQDDFSFLSPKRKQVEESVVLINENDPLDDFDDPQTMVFALQGKLLETRISIEGWNINEATVVVRTPKMNKGTPFKTTISPDSPWKFTQLHNVHNFLQLILIEIVSVSSMHDVSASQALKSIDKIESFLNQCISEFTQNRTVAPKSPQNNVVFYPRLPITLNIQFEILDTSWVTTAFILHPPVPGKPVQLTEEIGVDGKATRIGGLEVIEILQFSKPSKKLETISSYIQNLVEYCGAFRDKLVALSSVDVSNVR